MKWIKVTNNSWSESIDVVFFGRLMFYAGLTDHWGIGIEYCHYDRSLTFKIFKLYTGVEFLHKSIPEDQEEF